jgi:hypothetical protein
MSATVLGIDIDATGAFALVSLDGVLIDVVDMPIVRDGNKGRPSVDAPLQ